MISLIARLTPVERSRSGPGRTRTYDQWIHVIPKFPSGVDYLTTLNRTVRVRDALVFCNQQFLTHQLMMHDLAANGPALVH